ncbi:hypothetical protein D3C78_1983630 [compost metagenome]
MVALGDIAAGEFQAHHLFTGFHALGHHFQAAQALGQNDGGRHDRAVVMAV